MASRTRKGNAVALATLLSEQARSEGIPIRSTEICSVPVQILKELDTRDLYLNRRLMSFCYGLLRQSPLRRLESVIARGGLACGTSRPANPCRRQEKD